LENRKKEDFYIRMCFLSKQQRTCFTGTPLKGKEILHYETGVQKILDKLARGLGFSRR
jgi:hypothetical protein